MANANAMMTAALQQMMMQGNNFGSAAGGGGKGSGGKKREGDGDKGEGKKRPKGGTGTPGGPTQRAEVRYDDTYTAQEAVKQLNNSLINDTLINVELDSMSKDGTRVKVSNIPSEAGWQEVKDHFGTIGRVAFADIKGAGKGGRSGYGSNMPVSGIVRYDTTEQALAAIEGANGTMMGDRTIEVRMHGGTTDKTKISIFGMPPGTEWQDLKDHFAGFGRIAFAETLNPGIENQGVVRYDDPAHAQLACKEMNGTTLGGAPLTLQLDRSSKDLSKIIVHGIPAGIEWQELKDHFSPLGRVAYCDVKGSGKGKGGGKGGRGGGDMDDMMGMMGAMMGMGGGSGGMGKMRPNQAKMMCEFMEQMMNGITAMKGTGKGKGKGSKGGGGGMGGMGGMGSGGGMGGMMEMMGEGGWGGGCVPSAASPFGGGGGPAMSGQVGFANPMHAQFAIQMLDKSTLRGSHISVDWDYNSGDENTLWVGNVPSGTTEWDLSEHFSSIGLVEWAALAPAKKGKGKGGALAGALAGW